MADGLEGRRGPETGNQDVFILAVAHDLRASIGAVGGALDVLRAGVTDLSAEQLDSLLDTMSDAVVTAQGVIANLFDAERLQYGAARLVRAPTRLPELVARAIDASDGADRIETDVDDAVVDVDPGLTERILVNLLRNAITHTPAGTAVTICGRDEGDQVLLHIDDAGPGIPAELREHVFEPFHRSSGQGMGVGLHIVREFARLHGGDATIEELVDGGTSVRVRLPLR